jgi:transposase
LLKRVWTLPGQRPLAPVEPRSDWRSDWRYLVAFVHPASGRTMWHLATGVSAELFTAELAAFAQAVGAGPKKQIVLVLDQAGWHASHDVVVPEHVHLLFLPSHAPELQPCEHLWPFSDAPLVNRHFQDIDELEDVQLARCAVLQERRALIRSATLFSWWPKRIIKLQA